MKRLIWIALLSACVACSSSGDGTDESPDPGPNGTGAESAATNAEVDTPAEVAEEAETLTETMETSDASETTEAGESSDTADTAEATDSTETTVTPEESEETGDGEPAGTSDATETAEDAADEGDAADASNEPDMTDAVAAADPSESSDSDSPTDVTDSPDAAPAAADMLGIAAEKPTDGPFVETELGFMVPYKTTIPGTDAEFEMVPIRGGTFTMGSPGSEKDRGDDEGPQIEVEIAPFWMSKYELTWSEFRIYMDLADTFINFTGYGMRGITDENRCDAISAPSILYDASMTFKKGEDPRQPAVTMTAYAAKQYTKWLSKLTGDVYRLPSEAEWEYACRAGTSTTYPFGDDSGDLNDYAWWADNSEDTTHPVGEKEPNAWGLYDMIGNVAELVLDEYREDAYSAFEGKTPSADEALAWPTEYDNRVYRGGAFDDFEDGCRSAARKATQGDDWKTDDPNEPKSPWWFADPPSLSVGMRIVRPLVTPSQEVLDKVWEPSVDMVKESADQRINEGRGAWGLMDQDYPAAVEELKKKKAG